MVLLRVDVGRPAGEAFANRFGFRGTPAFLLVGADGVLLDRWTGYSGADAFVARMNRALDDLEPVPSRRAAFEREPTVGRALRLAEVLSDDGRPGDAIAVLRRAAAARPAQRDEALGAVAQIAVSGVLRGTLDVVAFRAEADRLLALQPPSAKALAALRDALATLEPDAGDPDLRAEYASRIAKELAASRQ